ncbi:AraC family transcriptional regulator [Paenibacillus doosanensis]|uniref:HTH-type transcriptional regulator YesS n=1 Tax=Paenibacillus konkukensis TaxID=2020716 RepID=A0ABY4RQV4_9BACL|nr:MULTISPECIES: AraC family transcriptional regulator [Paenibacillus]MCS7463233.1 AraC family transcriptional regulator [Paenibacillus doosanensis]UQZ84879.1 HTH-type transcriptional regulator YesS [Paenibacillus konkukensis]
MKNGYFRIRNPFAAFRKTMLRRMLVVSLLASVIPVIAVGVSSYLFSSSAIRNEVDQANARVLKHASYSIDSTLQRVRSNALQMLLGSFFSSNLTELKWNNYSGFYSSLFKNLSSLQNSNAEVGQIVMYIAEDDYLISPDGGGRKLRSEEERSQLRGWMASSEAMNWVHEPFAFLPALSNGTVGVTLVCQVPFQSSEPIGLLFVQLAPSFLQENMTKYSVYEGEQSFILDDKGEWVVSSGGQKVPDGLFEKVREQAASGSPFSFRWDNRDYLVTSHISSFNGWTYLDMVPIRELNAKSRGIAVITVAIIVIFLLLGGAATAWGTRRVYRPIEHLVSLVRGGRPGDPLADEIGYVQTRWAELNRETSGLQAELREQLPAIREAYALQFLQGHFAHYTLEQLEGMFERYEVPFRQAHAVFVLTYDQSPGSGSRFKASDKELIVFTIKNIAQDMLEQSGGKGIAVNLLNDKIAVWLWEDTDDSEDWYTGVHQFAKQLIDILSDYLKLPVTVGAGDSAGPPHEMPMRFGQAAMALRARFWAGTGQVIRSGDTGEAEPKPYPYPFEIEAGLEQALRVGDAAEAERQLERFAVYAQETLRETERIRTAYYQLMTATMRVAFIMNLKLEDLGDPSATHIDPYRQMNECRSIGELNDWFREQLVKPIARKMAQRQNQEYERTLDIAASFIQENYHLDLSLDQVAETCGLSPPYFSKLFKRVMGVSFIEYLTAYRIDQAKIWLRSTELSVTEVAEKVGYQPKNFIRVFKKQTGCTPGQFREAESGPT